MCSVRTLHPRRNRGITACFEEVVASLDVYNVFNPSFYWSPDVKIFAFRAIVRGQRCLSSFFSIEDHSGRTTRLLSPECFGNSTVPRFIDPKITHIGTDIFITFNSGWIESGNDVYIMQIYPAIGLPKRILYGNRMTQERNWAFFHERGEVYALYWINPLKILRLKATTSDHWEMEDHYHSESIDAKIPADLTVGTQLAPSREGYCFIAHQKRLVRNRKLYLGRFCVLDFESGTIRAGKHWLVHSFASILESRVKHNTNLFSCTYFSGIQASQDELTLGYGINDIDYGFATLSPNEL